MKKRWCSVCAFLIVFLLCSTVAWGEANPIVRFGADNQITYIGSNATAEGNLIGDTFQGMAPGETRTQTITLSNENRLYIKSFNSLEAKQIE